MTCCVTTTPRGSGCWRSKLATLSTDIKQTQESHIAEKLSERTCRRFSSLPQRWQPKDDPPPPTPSTTPENKELYKSPLHLGLHPCTNPTKLTAIQRPLRFCNQNNFLAVLAAKTCFGVVPKRRYRIIPQQRRSRFIFRSTYKKTL